MSEVKPPEFEPPAACVARVIKAALPDNCQITKDARASFARAAGIFIFYLTHCANDFAHENKRQTIYTQDVLNSLKELDFEEFTSPLEEFLEVYRKDGEAKKLLMKDKRGNQDMDEMNADVEDIRAPEDIDNDEDNINNEDDMEVYEDEDS